MGVENSQVPEEVKIEAARVVEAAVEAAANAQEGDPRSEQGAKSLMELANN